MMNLYVSMYVIVIVFVWIWEVCVNARRYATFEPNA